LESTFKRLSGYEHIFEVIRPFQDKQIREDIINRYEEERTKIESSRKSSQKEFIEPKPEIKTEVKSTPSKNAD
jgi:response regulator of citrate/malate metabolism